MRLRWGAYAGVSAALAGGVVIKAFAQRPNFYSAAVYLAQSNASLMILTNLIFVAACTFLLSLQKLLYGPLRPIEIEQLYEKAWFAVTETCLAMTIFRGEIGASFLVMFFALLTGKVWGWIGEGRVEILEQQPPMNPRLFHTRLATSLILSVLFDTWMLEYVIKQVLDMARPDMMVMFGFEFAVLSVLSLSTLARYGISLVEILIVRGQKFRRAEEIRKERIEAREAELRVTSEGEIPGSTTTPVSNAEPSREHDIVTIFDESIDDSELEVEGWEEKGRYIFYLDLTTDFFKLVIYMSFFFILLVFYGLPIHIMRDVFLTCRSFFKRIGDFIRYRTATKDMNERYPDATAEEIGREDVCIICREEMRVMPRAAATTEAGAAPQPRNAVAERMRPKKLPCGHVLHFSCLRSWLERQQICPTCRRPVVPTVRTQAGVPAAGGGVGGGFGQGFADGMNAARGRVGQNHAQQQNGQGQAQVDGGALEHQNQNRARIFQLGPLRIGIGAGRGLMMEDLAQRIHDGDAAPGAQNQPGNTQNGARQYGFGFGFGRSNRRTHSRRTDVQGQIDSAERQIQREIESLRLSATELGVVRLLQAELARLRASRSQQNLTATSAATQGTGAGGTTTQAQTSAQSPIATGFVADMRQNVLEAGSEALPPGLTLPEGWTMMPLQRMQPRTQIPSMGTAFTQPGGSGQVIASGQIQFPPGQAPDLMQAMQNIPLFGQMGMPQNMQNMQNMQQVQQMQQMQAQAQRHILQAQATQQPNGTPHHHHHHHHAHAHTGAAGAAGPADTASEAMQRMQSTMRRQQEQMAQITRDSREFQRDGTVQNAANQPQQAVNGDAGPTGVNGTEQPSAIPASSQPPPALHHLAQFGSATQFHDEVRRQQAQVQEQLERMQREFGQNTTTEDTPMNGNAAAQAQGVGSSTAVEMPMALPAWGTSSRSGNGLNQPSNTDEPTTGTTEGSREVTTNGDSGGSEPGASRKPQPVTVEDLVEGPD